jgi:hypothetical protein
MVVFGGVGVVVAVVVVWAVSLSRSGLVCIDSFCIFTDFRSNILCG